MMAGAALFGGTARAWGKMTEGKEIVVSGGALATEPEEAVRAGARILKAGGNAFDALAAAALATSVLQQELCGIGGYVACGLALEGKTGRIWAIDANSVAPALAREDMYRVLPKSGAKGLNEIEYQVSVEHNANVHGPLAVGVPAQLAGIGILHERWGRLKWTQVIAPAQEIVAAGFPYSNAARSIASQRAVLGKIGPASRYLMPSGAPPKPEDIWRPSDLENSLKRLAAAGWRDLYQGDLGRKIADYVQSLHGILTREDMARFEPRISEPLRTAYRGVHVYAAPLTNGGLTVIQALNMLEVLPARPVHDRQYWHQLAEVFKLCWRDRLRYFGDPDFSNVAVEQFSSKGYAAGRVETLRQFPEQVDLLPGATAGASPGTVHISAGDSEGNLAAMTVSHGGLFGSCLVVPGTGIVLGHGMCRFDPRPGRPNSVGAGKRPLNNVCPTILRLPDRDVALGLRGGRRIVSVAAQLVLRVVDHHLSPSEAAAAPRLHVEEHEPIELTENLDSNIAGGLAAMGHQPKRVPNVGGWSHLVEVARNEGRIRAGGDIWAAGV